VPAVDSGVCPSSVAVDAAGNLYIADFNSGRIRRVNTSGIITTSRRDV
jgi:DNA-binding beta-propeller fold protein YncE